MVRQDIRTKAVSGRGSTQFTTQPWDVADHLGDSEDMANYLEAALEDGDTAVIGAALGDIARAQGNADLAQ